MATYTLTDVAFEIANDGILASGKLLKDGAPFQNFSKMLPKTTDKAVLIKQVADYCKMLVIYDALTSSVFLDAKTVLEAGSWTYG